MHPVTAAENFGILLLVGADFYWDLVGDHIIQGDGPTTMNSKLGYLQLGPVLLPRNPSAIVNILHVATEHDQKECGLLRLWQIEDTVITPDVVRNPNQQFLKSYSESQILQQDDKTYCTWFSLEDRTPPFTGQPQCVPELQLVPGLPAGSVPWFAPDIQRHLVRAAEKRLH